MDTKIYEIKALEQWEEKLNELYDIVTDPKDGIIVRVRDLVNVVFGNNGDSLFAVIKSMKNDIDLIQSTIENYIKMDRDYQVRYLEEKEKARKARDIKILTIIFTAIIGIAAGIMSTFIYQLF